MPAWAAALAMILHMLTTLAALVWLIVKNLRTEKRFNHHLAVCHPEELANTTKAGKDTGD